MENKKWFETNTLDTYSQDGYRFSLSKNRWGIHTGRIEYAEKVIFNQVFWASSDILNIKAIMLVSAREHYNMSQEM